MAETLVRPLPAEDREPSSRGDPHHDRQRGHRSGSGDRSRPAGRRPVHRRKTQCLGADRRQPRHPSPRQPPAPAVQPYGCTCVPRSSERRPTLRYGFSFQYPLTWERQDPVNGDGLLAIGPQLGLEVRAYGALPTTGGGGDQVGGGGPRVDEYVEYLTQEGGTVVDGPTQQNVRVDALERDLDRDRGFPARDARARTRWTAARDNRGLAGHT